MHLKCWKDTKVPNAIAFGIFNYSLFTIHDYLICALGFWGDKVIRYNKLRKLNRAKKRHGLPVSGRMKLRHTF